MSAFILISIAASLVWTDIVHPIYRFRDLSQVFLMSFTFSVEGKGENGTDGVDELGGKKTERSRFVDVGTAAIVVVVLVIVFITYSRLVLCPTPLVVCWARNERC